VSQGYCPTKKLFGSLQKCQNLPGEFKNSAYWRITGQKLDSMLSRRVLNLACIRRGQSAKLKSKGSRGEEHLSLETYADCARAAHKKFASRQEAEAFIASESSRPYAKSQLVAPKTKQKHQTSVMTSEPTSARDLPTNLAELAKAGFTITPTKPHHLVVYTDGSSRGNGKTGARAGLGVWWSDQRPASKQ
jgi:hypothetical protein